MGHNDRFQNKDNDKNQFCTPDIETKIIKNPTDDDLEFCASVIKRGGLVAFPTETVYGVGADALNDSAVRKVFAAKNRPLDNPLILHVSSFDDIHKFCSEIPVNPKCLDRFIPGPLTLVLKKSNLVPDLVSGNLPTVAIRIPDNETAIKLIKLSGTPIAAPSANRSGRPSSTKAEHVITDLKGKVDVIIDQGPCKFGIESTVIDLSSDTPAVLRLGSIPADQLMTVFPTLVCPSDWVESKNNYKSNYFDDEVSPKSPGMKYKHYAPSAPLYIVNNIQEFSAKLKREYNSTIKIGVLSLDDNIKLPENFIVKNLGSSIQTQSQKLFAFLREFDDLGVKLILAPKLSGDNLCQAVANRLYKAASYVE